MDVAGEHPGAGGNLEERLPQGKPNVLLLPTAGVDIWVPGRNLETA